MKFLLPICILLIFVSCSFGQIGSGDSSSTYCPESAPCRCPDSSCKTSTSQCPTNPCNGTTPYLCSDGKCAIAAIYCNCMGVVCWDGSCKTNMTQCPMLPSCPELLPRRCPDGTCQLANTTCAGHTGTVCPTGLTLCLDGICRTSANCKVLPFSGCAKFQCAKGNCVNNYTQCLCPSDPNKLVCIDGNCTLIGTKCAATAPAFIVPMNVSVTVSTNSTVNITVPSSNSQDQTVVNVVIPPGTVDPINGTTVNVITVQGVSTGDSAGATTLDPNGNLLSATIVSSAINVNFVTGQSQLNDSVTLTFPNVPASGNDSTLCVATLIDGNWICSDYSSVVTTGNTSVVSSNVSHFSTYAILHKPIYECTPKCNEDPCYGTEFALETLAGARIGTLTVKNGENYEVDFYYETFKDLADPTYGWKLLGVTVEVGVVKQSIDYANKNKFSDKFSVQLSTAFPGQTFECFDNLQFSVVVNANVDGPCTNGCNDVIIGHAAPIEEFQGVKRNLPVIPSPVPFYTQNYTLCCSCEYRTEKASEFARSCSSSALGCYEDEIFGWSYPVGMTLGCKTGNSITINTADALRTYLNQANTQSGTPHALTASYVDPTITNSGSFGGQLATLSLSERFDRWDIEWQSSCNFLRNLHICATYASPCNSFHNKTVGTFLQKANNVLGGCEGGNPSTYTKCIVWITDSLIGGKEREEFESRGLSTGFCN